MAIILMIGIHSIQVGSSQMDPLVSFLRDGTLPRTKVRPRRFKEKPRDIGFPRSRNYINAPNRDRIYYVSIPRP